MRYLALLLVLFLQEVPFKSKNEFEIKLNYEFKQRPAPQAVKVSFEKSVDSRDNQAILPYLALDINILSVGPATRVKFSNNSEGYTGSKKVKDGSQFHLVIGFTDDVKDRVTAHEHILTFIDNEKRELSRIVLFIDTDGTFLVNGEQRGRF